MTWYRQEATCSYIMLEAASHVILFGIGTAMLYDTIQNICVTRILDQIVWCPTPCCNNFHYIALWWLHIIWSPGDDIYIYTSVNPCIFMHGIVWTRFQGRTAKLQKNHYLRCCIRRIAASQFLKQLYGAQQLAKWLRSNSFGCTVASKRLWSQSKHTQDSKWLWRGNIVSSSLQWLRRSFRAAISSAQ